MARPMSSTFVIKGVSQDAIQLHLFPFSLLGRAKQWFYANKTAVDTWDKCAKAFLAKFFPIGKTNALRGRISNFQQASNESIPEAWERLQEYILACLHHRMDNYLILQNFCNGLTQSSRDHVDATVGGALFLLTIERATSLIEKMVSNQGWSDDHLQPCQRCMHSVKEADMLAMKIDLLLKKFEDYSQDKAQMQTLQALETCMMCEVCGNVMRT